MQRVVRVSYLRSASLVVAFLVAPLSVPFAEAAGQGHGRRRVRRRALQRRHPPRGGAVESLRVCQDMDEPQTDGTTRHARAVLSYARGEGMERRVLSSNLAYPAGEYTLTSLIGPILEPSEYRIRLEGTTVVDGVDCHHLVVEAIKRDKDHLDGEVWVSRSSFALVRILGQGLRSAVSARRDPARQAVRAGPRGFRTPAEPRGRGAGRTCAGEEARHAIHHVPRLRRQR